MKAALSARGHNAILECVSSLELESVLDIGGTCKEDFDERKVWTQAVSLQDASSGRLVLGRGYDLVVCFAEKMNSALFDSITFSARKYALINERHLERFLDYGMRFVWGKANYFLMEKTHYRVNSKDWWDAKGKRYEQKGDLRNREEDAVPAAKRICSPVLEVGSAFGSFLKYLGPDVCYMGIEISEYMVARARAICHDGLFVQGDFLEMDEKWYGAFATVCAFQVIEHFPNSNMFLEKAMKLARHNLVFDVPRGLPTGADQVNEGHIIGWKDEDAVIEDFDRFGRVSFWKGAKHHICGELVFSAK